MIEYDELSGRCLSCGADTLWGDAPHAEDCVTALKNKVHQLEKSNQRTNGYLSHLLNTLQTWQATIPDPYRQECCDILANGQVAPWHKRPNRPVVVCLCGSTRFYETFQRANFEETMAGKIVLSVGFYPHASVEAHGEEVGITPDQKDQLDQLHLRKIDLADEILVLNVGGYIGESTAKEIKYAKEKGKCIRFLEGICVEV